MAIEDLPAHVDIVLNGKAGTAMVAWNMLNDLELAAIITYERNAWGNDTGDIVQPADIKAAR
jgi:cytochrome c oxidase subunit 2